MSTQNIPVAAAQPAVPHSFDPETSASGTERFCLTFECELERRNFRSMRSPLELEAEAIGIPDASGWTTRSL